MEDLYIRLTTVSYEDNGKSYEDYEDYLVDKETWDKVVSIIKGK